jgi:outer membrane protein OmpA-like peptidoglycan-associated protein
MIINRNLALLFFVFSSCFVCAKTVYAKTKVPALSGLTTECTRKLPQSDSDTTVIRFDYKQSALFYAYTYSAIDSVVDILLKNKAVTLSIHGYAYKDEGSDTICYYISLNRALFVKTYVLGRGIDSSRIIALTAWGNRRQTYRSKDKEGHFVNCRAEILINYPPAPKKNAIMDRDEDGILDNEDVCPNVFGLQENKGCPDSNAVFVPFSIQESTLYSMAYLVLDSILTVLKENPAYTISIAGHAYKSEGIQAVCMKLATERSEIVKQYLISRQLHVSRISSVKNYGNQRPLNAGKTPLAVALNARAEIIIKRN